MSRRLLVGALLTGASAVALGACGSVIASLRPSVGSPGVVPARGVYGVGQDIYGTGGGVAGIWDTTRLGRARDRGRVTPAAGGQLAQRTVCRATGVPGGWIAVAYQASTEQCPGGVRSRTDSAATAAVIVRYAGAPLGTRLDVCADQGVPSGWIPATDEGPGDVSACPGAARSGQSTVRRIERVN